MLLDSVLKGKRKGVQPKPAKKGDQGGGKPKQPRLKPEKQQKPAKKGGKGGGKRKQQPRLKPEKQQKTTKGGKPKPQQKPQEANGKPHVQQKGAKKGVQQPGKKQAKQQGKQQAKQQGKRTAPGAKSHTSSRRQESCRGTGKTTTSLQEQKTTQQRSQAGTPAAQRDPQGQQEGV